MKQSFNFLRASRSIAKTGFRGVFYGGLKMRSNIVLKKWLQRVPNWTPKVDQNRHKGCSGGVPKSDLKKVPSPGSGKVRSGYRFGVDFGDICVTFVCYLCVTFVLPLCYLCVTFWLLLAPILEQFWHPFGRLHDFPERGSGTFTERSLNVH